MTDSTDDKDRAVLSAEAPELDALLRRLAAGLQVNPEAPPLRTSAARLQAATAQLPLRYAPFYDELCRWSELTESELRVELTRAADPKSWGWSPLRGVRFFAFAPATRLAPECLLVRLEEGGALPEHSHPAGERALVLEGGYRDDSGREFHAGDEDEALAGSRHALTVLPGGPCVTFLRLEERFVFRPLMPRLLLRWFWKRPAPLR